MEKRGISPLIATLLLVGLTIVLATGIGIWSQGITKSEMDGTELSPIIVDFDVEISSADECEEGYHCYGILITNNENFGVNYLVITSTSEGTETESPEDYYVEPFQSKLFTISYDENLGKEEVRTRVDAVSLN